MAKHIRKEFQYDLPDEYLSNESTLGLKAQWTYDGPEKIWVFVDYKTNKILARESFREYDEENPEAQYEFLEVYTGFNSYPVVISFDDDPLLLSSIAQIAPEMKDLPTKKYFHPETKELFYERPHPTVPDHTIEIADCEYDPKLKRWTVSSAMPAPIAVPTICPNPSRMDLCREIRILRVETMAATTPPLVISKSPTNQETPPAIPATII